MCRGSGVFPSVWRLLDRVWLWQLCFSHYVTDTAAHARVTFEKSVSVQERVTKEIFKLQVRLSGQQWRILTKSSGECNVCCMFHRLSWFQCVYLHSNDLIRTRINANEVIPFSFYQLLFSIYYFYQKQCKLFNINKNVSIESIFICSPLSEC